MKEELSKKTRTESDLIGSREIPETAMYGVQTLRGIENFRISKFHLNEYPLFINALAITKMGAAVANFELGLLTEQQADAILEACKEILEGKHHEQFPVDMIQGGAGTTTNMNANEVIANRALEILGHKRGEYQYCSPNDHVNRSQSTNDAYPTAIHIGMYYTHLKLVKHFEELIDAFQRKAEEFKHIIKMGRTQLEDAVPMTLGQTFNGFASILRDEIKNLNFAAEEFLTVNMGATAIGTGITAEPEYAERCVKALRKITGWEVKLSADLVGATSDTSCLVGYSSAMRRVAVKMNKICNDLRLLASGPRCGLGEINLPAMQPGSSIMPGKVNPVIPEVTNQASFLAIGLDTTVMLAASAGQLELNVMEPVITFALFMQMRVLTNACNALRTKCIDGITANAERTAQMVMNSCGIVTLLKPHLGYKVCSEMAHECYHTGKALHQVVVEERKLLTQEEWDATFNLQNLIAPKFVQ